MLLIDFTDRSINAYHRSCVSTLLNDFCHELRAVGVLDIHAEIAVKKFLILWGMSRYNMSEERAKEYYGTVMKTVLEAVHRGR